MALIPYAHLPPPHDPPILVAEQPLEEYYCGDARCDCATANVMFAGVPLVIDLGTTRVDFHNEREGQTTPAREALRETLRATLQQGAINQLREHYVKVREWGRDWHFRYMDYTRLKAGDVVGWEQIFRHLGTPIYTLSAKAQEGGEAEEIRLGMADAYCVIPRCDCQRVVWSVVSAAPDGQGTRPLGTVEFRFATGQHSVLNAAQGVSPNQLFMIVANLLRARPDFISEAQQRYAFMREQVTPLLQAQRTQSQQPSKQPVVGRNDACPCGSGKKFKRCHGR